PACADRSPAVTTPTVSVVVATHTRAHLLPRLMAALEAQVDAGPFEAVVVDDGSTDGTWTELQRLARTASVPVEAARHATRAGPAAARNAGWRRARGPVVAFADDDGGRPPRRLGGI